MTHGDEDIHVPSGYIAGRAVDDLADLIMRLMLAADRAGLLEQVRARVETHLTHLRMPDG